jgi:uncharacterized damage-inducible protein DinB
VAKKIKTMNKKYFSELADYNIWANNIVFDWLNEINDEQWNQAITSSFSSIADTSIHIAGAEKIWLERWQQVQNPTFLSTEFKGTKNELIEIWKKASKDLQEYIYNLPEEKYSSQLTFKRLNGDEYTMQFAETFSHIINHSTFHRGQLVTMLRQAGFTKVTSTDLLTYYRSIQQ